MTTFTPPKPLFCLIRPGLERFTAAGELIVQPGTIVPLIPMDLLPEWLEVVGVPRQLRLEEAKGMTSVGSYHPETDTYRLKIHVSGEDAASRAETSDSTDTSVAGLSEPSSKPCPSRSQPARGLASSRHNPLNEATPPRPVSPAQESTSNSPIGESSNTPRDAHCRRWCNSGTCKWGVSCRFKHSMPSTSEGLASVGLGEHPEWWLTAIGVRSPPPGDRSDAGASTKKQTKKRKQKKTAEKADKVWPGKKDRKAKARAGREGNEVVEESEEDKVPSEMADLIEI